MKRTLLFLATLVALSVQAERRTDAEMRSHAQQALTASQQSTRLRAKAANASLQVLTDRSQLTLFGAEGLGWVMVSKDDAFSPILGYSDEPLDITNPAPAFLWLMECFNAGMENDLASPAATERAKARRKVCSVLRPVSPLLKTNWDQFWPYNTKCPKVKQWSEKEGAYVVNSTLTGCVATALAQVFYYHKLPKKMHGKKTYIWYNKEEDKRVPLSYDFGENPFQWDKILVSYAGSPSQKNIDAISDLMYGCGVLANMGYGISGSGANVNQTIKSVNAYCEDVRGLDFGYKMDLEVIARELNAKRPVIFAGANEKGEGGHCFVIDGADDKGLLHCNLGWSGSGNGYYSSEDMNGYPTAQQLSGIMPAENVTVSEPLEELQNYTLTADVEHPATEIEVGRWYALWNRGRALSLCDAGKGKNVTTQGCAPAGQFSPYVAGQAVRFTTNTAGTRYYIQTGLGNYIPSFEHNKPAAATTTKGNGFTFTQFTDSTGTLIPDVFCIRTSTDVRLDCNGMDIVGWETGMTTDATGNAAWQLYPITLTPATDLTAVSSISLGADTLRMVVGGILQLEPDVLPATASVPQVVYSSTKGSVATVDVFGQVQSVAAGTTTLAASAADGSGQKARALLMVGTEKAASALTSLRTRGVYTLRYYSNHKGCLMASSEADTHPQLRGILNNGGYTVKNSDFWEDAQIGSPLTLWQVVESSEGEQYLFNVGTQKFLVPDESGEQYVFSTTPAPIFLSEAQANDKDDATFKNVVLIGDGPTPQRFLMAHAGNVNPAQALAATADNALLCRWQFCEVTGVSTGLPLLTLEALDEMLAPDGIHTIGADLTSTPSTPYDLTGRPVRSTSIRGIFIKDGKKITR